MKATLTIDREVAFLLAEAARQTRSGILTAVRGKLKRIFCLDRGAIVHATSNMIEEQLLEFLARHGHLKPSDVVRAVEHGHAGPGSKPARYLLDHHVLTPDALDRSLVARVRELLFSTLDWPTGEAELTPGRPKLEGEVTVALSPVGLLLEYARKRPSSIGEVQMRVGPPNARLVLSAQASQVLEGRELGPLERKLVELCTEGSDTSQLLAESGVAPEATWRAIYGLVLAGAVVGDLTRRTQEEARGGVSREEILARLKRASDSDYYTILELTRSADRREIREAYYFLARRYHPDRFRAGPIADLLSKIEEYFSKVTEAYNTLHDAELRASYDEQQSAETGPRREVEQDTSYLAKQNFARAKTLAERGRFTDAVVALENAISQDPTQAVYYLELGRLLAQNPRRRKDAEELLVRANQVDPALAEGYLVLGDLYVKTSRLEEAGGMYREVLRWEPGHLDATARLKALKSGADEGGILRGLFGGN